MATGGDAVDHSHTTDGQRDLDAIVSAKIFNSGIRSSLGSTLGFKGDTSKVKEPPIDAQEDLAVSQPLGSLSSTSTSASAGAVGDTTTNSPRARGQDSTAAMTTHRSSNNDSDVDQQYPPTPSKTATFSNTPGLTLPLNVTISKHPQLLPFASAHQDATVTPSASTSASSSTHSSFEENDRDANGYPNQYSSGRTAVSHPGQANGAYGQNNAMTDSSTSSGSASFPRDSSAGVLNDTMADYQSSGNGKHHKNSSTGFAKIGTARRSMQIFGTPPVGIIGIHKPREIIRIDRDYSSGEICQFWSGYPFELEGRINATQHLNVLNEFNNTLASAFDPYKSIFDNVLAVLSLYLSTWLMSSHYDKEIAKFDRMVTEANQTLYNPAGLNLINPKKNGYLFLEIEYY